MALTDQLVSYWKLEEASGDRADSSGNGRALSVAAGAPGNAVGKLGNAASFNYLNNDGLTSSDAAFNFADTDFTVAGWAKMTAAGILLDPSALIAKGTTAVSSDAYHLGCSASFATFYWVCRTSGAFGQATWSAPVSANTWYYVVAWHDSVNNVIGIDVNPSGSPVTTAYSNGVRSTAGPFSVGIQGIQLFDGLIDAVGIWSRVLSSSERASLYNSGNGLEYPFVSGPPKFLPEALAFRPIMGAH